MTVDCSALVNDRRGVLERCSGCFVSIAVNVRMAEDIADCEPIGLEERVTLCEIISG